MTVDYVDFTKHDEDDIDAASETPMLPSPSYPRQVASVRRLVIEQFVKHQQYRGLSRATILRRRNVLGQLAEFLEPLPLERATQTHLEQFIGTKTAPRTKHAYRSDLRVFYAWALSHGLMETNPSLLLDSIRLPKALPRPLSPEIAQSLLWYGSVHVRRMVGLMMFAGLRCFEVAKLEAGDIWRHHRPPVIVVRNGKGAKDRSVPLHAELASLLEGAPASGPLFPSPSGSRPLRAESVSRAVTRHMQICGIEATPHQLRHSFITEVAYRSRGNMPLTASLAGHESMDTTMGYVRLIDTGGADVVSKLYASEDVA